MKYFKIKKTKGCIFCACRKAQKNDYVIFRTSHSLAVLNIFPYNNGHLLIAPLRHVADISQLEEAESLDLFKSITQAKKLIGKVLKPEGYNIGINLSRTGGAGIIGHLHIHLVPRWIGDTNFMTTVHNTKVISQSLAELYKSLKNARSRKD
jgi:ATP adenylyltransferase